MTSSRTTASLVGTVGALVFTGVGVLQTIDPTFPREPAFAGRNVPSAVGAFLMAGLVVGLLTARQRTVSGAVSNER